MPRTGKNAEKWDARDHSFGFVSPVSTDRFGTPNPCNSCHSEKSTEWALEIINAWKR